MTFTVRTDKVLSDSPGAFPVEKLHMLSAVGSADMSFDKGKKA